MLERYAVKGVSKPATRAAAGQREGAARRAGRPFFWSRIKGVRSVYLRVLRQGFVPRSFWKLL